MKDFDSVKTDPDIVSYTKTKVEEAIEEQVTTKRNKINDRGSVRWAQYSGGKVCDMNRYGTEREYAEVMYRCNNSIVRRLMAFDCDDTTPREKKDETIRLGNGMYPTTITEASALLTASARAKKTKLNKKRNDNKMKNQNRNDSSNGAPHGESDSEQIVDDPDNNGEEQRSVGTRLETKKRGVTMKMLV